MDDKNLTRALSILNRLNPMLQQIESKRLLAERVQHFIDRYVDLLQKKRDVEYLQVFFACRFVKQIQASLPVPIDSK